MPHRISPAFVVPFEEWEKCTDFLEDLETKERFQNIFSVSVYYAEGHFHFLKLTSEETALQSM